MRRLVCLLRGHVNDGQFWHNGRGSARRKCSRCGRFFDRFIWYEEGNLTDSVGGWLAVPKK